MTYTFHISYFRCQSCASRSHCQDCGRQLEEQILELPGVEHAAVRLQENSLLLQGQWDEDSLVDALETMGIFPD